jgi:hypothetical protein
MSDESTAILQGQLERAVTGDAQARQHLLELTRDRLMRQARRFLHGHCARLEPFEQTDDVVQQLYLEILQNQDRFWVNADTGPRYEPSSNTLDREKVRRWTAARSGHDNRFLKWCRK